MNLLLDKMAGNNEKEGFSCPSQDYDDDIAMISSTESLDLEYQMTMKFNKLLPYADELEKEATKLLSDIKGELGRAVALRKYYPDCNLAAMKLASYIKLYNLRFTKEDHILFIKLMYELIIVEDQDIDLLQTFAGTLGLLLKKPKTLSPSDIELSWRPLYELSMKLNYTSYSTSGMYRCCTRTAKIVNWATSLARNYFPVSATQEILDELRPMICPLINPSTNKAIATLEFLLPICLPPELHHVGFHLWFDELMTLWNTCINETAWQNSMMSLMSKLATKNIGYINWEPHIPIMFTRFVRSLNLPVYYKNNKGGRLYKIDTIPIATWIVAVLGGNSSCQMHLEKFLKTIETYFYQANSGPWAGKLKDLICKIVVKFINRLHSEKYPKITWETPVPDSHKLTNADIDAFVKSIMPIAMTSMFGHTGIDQIDWVFRVLGMIRPSMIIPDVIERMFSTLDSLTEPHKLTAAMSAITALARPLVQGRRHACTHYSYNEGPSRVLPLLMSSLPGIDGNDLIKTFATFHLISVYTALVPMIDCSHAKMDMLNDEDRLVCQDTAQFEDFVLQFFERIFSLIESSTLDYVAHDTKESNLKSRIEKTTEMVLGSTCLILLLKTSSDIYQTALHKLKIFITERVLETRISGPLAATVCRSFAEINGKETLKALLPPLIDTIMELVKEGDVTKDEHPDIRFMYALQLIGPLVDVKGEDLLGHIDTLIELLDKVIYIESSEGNMLTADILRNLLNALGRISISSHYMCYGKDYNNPNYPYILDWGKGADIKDIDFQWCIPGEDEIGAMQKIFNRYLLVEVDRIKRYIAGDNTINRNNLATSLGMIDAILNGCILYLPVLDDDSRKPAHELLVCIGVTYEIKMPNGDNVRETMVKLLTDLQEVLLTTNADDTKSLKNLCHIWGILLLGKYIDRDNHKNQADSIKLLSGELKDYYINKRKHLAECILERVQLQHNIRVHSNYYSMRKIHEHILLQLFKLATSTYAAVRCAAQSVLSLAQSYFTSMCNVLQPKIMELLEKDPDENHEEIKGLYYVLLGPRKNPLISINNWNFRKNVWLGIVRAKPSEKLSMIKLRNAICDDIYVALNPPINMKLTDSAIKVAKELWTTSPRPSYSLPSDEEIEEAYEDMKKQIIENQENYDKLVDDIVSAIEINCHWRQRLLGITCLNRLAYPERPYTPRCINFFLNTLVHGSSEERGFANASVITILRQQKRSHKKIKITPPKIPDNAPWGIRPDNLWLQYNYENRPKSESQWNNNRYIHLSYIGYYTWPKEIEIYAPYNEQPSLDEDRILTQSEKIIEDFFCNLDNITKLIQYNYNDCRKGGDKFQHVRFQMFKSLFRNLGIKPLSNILSCLNGLLENDADGGHYCTAEILAGLIRGSKHWPYEMTVCMWEMIRPVIKIGLNKMTPDTAKDWSICFGQSTKNRDPNRQWWLFEYLMKEKADSNITSFRECQKLNMIYAALNKQSWRITELNVRLLDRLERRLLSNPFQNIRDSLGNLLSLIFCDDIDQSAPPGFSIPSARDFMNRYIPQILKLGDIDTAQLENHKQEIILAETIFKWITARGFSSPQGTLPCSARLLPVLCQLENYDGDEELRAACRKTLATLAQAQALPPVIGEILDEISKVFNMNSWSSRTAALNFIEVFVFHHMAVIICKPEWVSMIQGIVINSLEDERVEVREKAGQVLGGLLHCEFVPEQELLLGKFEKKSRMKIKSPDDLRLRHAGVLGLCAFIMAHPYDVPQYMPSIFEYLSFCLNDPQPIPTTIRKTLGNFKRTHYDGWSSHAQAFTEEQLAILQDLTVPPSHYA